MQFHNPEAREEMIRAHLGLARRVAARFKHAPLCFEDRVSEGILGLIAAVDAFDPGRGAAFATFAEHWVRAAIQRAIRAEKRYRRFAALSLEQSLDCEAERGTVGETVAEKERGALVEHTALQAEVAAALQSLPPRQGVAARLRFGLNGGPPLAFAETARRLGISETRLAQILARARKRLRRALSNSGA